MINLTPLEAFYVFLKYLTTEEGYWEHSIELACVLSDISFETKAACHTGGPTGDPAAWYNWCNLVADVLRDQESSVKLIPAEKLFLTREQALKVTSCFLQKRYWDKNPRILLRDVLSDINQCLSKQSLESTEIWKQWLDCVPKGLMFNEIFDEAYSRKLAEMKVEHLKAKGDWWR